MLFQFILRPVNKEYQNAEVYQILDLPDHDVAATYAIGLAFEQENEVKVYQEGVDHARYYGPFN